MLNLPLQSNILTQSNWRSHITNLVFRSKLNSLSFAADIVKRIFTCQQQPDSFSMIYSIMHPYHAVKFQSISPDHISQELNATKINHQISDKNTLGHMPVVLSFFVLVCPLSFMSFFVFYSSDKKGQSNICVGSYVNFMCLVNICVIWDPLCYPLFKLKGCILSEEDNMSFNIF